MSKKIRSTEECMECMGSRECVLSTCPTDILIAEIKQNRDIDTQAYGIFSGPVHLSAFCHDCTHRKGSFGAFCSGCVPDQYVQEGSDTIPDSTSRKKKKTPDTTPPTEGKEKKKKYPNVHFHEVPDIPVPQPNKKKVKDTYKDKKGTVIFKDISHLINQSVCRDCCDLADDIAKDIIILQAGGAKEDKLEVDSKLLFDMVEFFIEHPMHSFDYNALKDYFEGVCIRDELKFLEAEGAILREVGPKYVLNKTAVVVRLLIRLSQAIEESVQIGNKGDE